MDTTKTQNDFPPSLALLVLAGVGFGYLYITQLRFHPQALMATFRDLEAHLQFWSAVVIAAALNLAIIGSFVRRSIGLEKQGSRLKQLEGNGFRFRLSRFDLIGPAIGALVFWFMRGFTFGRLRVLSVIVSRAVVTDMDFGIRANFTLLASALIWMMVRRLRKMKLKKSPNLEKPPFEHMTLVLGTTPVTE